MYENALGSVSKAFYGFFSPVYLFVKTLEMLAAVGSAVITLLGKIYTNLQWIFVILAIWLAALFFFSHGFAVIEGAEYVWRCYLEPVWEEILRPFFVALVEIWKNICWWNLIRETQGLLGGKLIWITLQRCDNGFRIWDMILDVVNSFVALFKIYFSWFFAGNAISSAIPIYPWYASVTGLGKDLGQMMICLCEDLRPVFLLFTRVVTSNNLICMISQLTNALLSVLQAIISFGIDCIKTFVYMVFNEPGDLGYFVSLLSGEIPGFELPTLIPTTERTAVAAYYGGQFLNEALQILICTGISEIEIQGNVSAAEFYYQQCLANNETKNDLFCWTGPLVGGFYRLERAIFSAVINIPRILYEFVSLPPGNRFLTEDWIVDQVYDTVRYPPLRYDYSTSVNAPTVILGSNQSAIVPLRPEIYGNYTNASDVSCYDANVSRFVIPCANCSEVEQYDLETCICNAARDIDRLIENLLDFKVLDGFLCCLGGKILRIMTAVVKFVQGLICHIIVIDRFDDFVTDQNNWDVPIDEFIGPYYRIGGLLECCGRILKGFDTRLECLCTVFINLIKVMGETFRLLLDFVVRALNDLFDTGEIGFFDVACTTQPSCVDLELRIFQYLRTTRIDVINVTDPNFLDIDLPINDTLPKAWIECFCELISFQFLNQFQDDPLPTVPDFCCGLLYGFRGIVELVKFGAGLLLTVFETVGTLFDPNRPFTLAFFGYLACETPESCAPIPQILSDIRAFLKCDCALVQSIDDIIDPTKQDILCVCDFFNAIANAIYYLLRAFVLTGQTVVALIDCVGRGFPVGPDCGMSPPGCVGSACDSRLADRVHAIFDNYDSVLDEIGNLFGTIGCFLGLLFRFDCVGTRYYSPVDWPVCNEGSSYGVCAMGDRLTRFFKDSFQVLAVIPHFILDTIKGFALVAFNVVFSGWTGIADLIGKFLLALGAPFWGIADPVNPTTGWIHSLCLLLNCLLGPDTSDCVNELSPALDSNASGACIGDILCVVGNAIRDVYADIVSLFTSLVGIVEALFAGNGDLLAQRIIQFFTSLISILVDIIGSLENLIQAFIASIVGIANAILPGFGSLLEFALNIAFGVAQVLLIIIGNLLSLFMPKRAFDANGSPDDPTADALISDFLANAWRMDSTYLKSNVDRLTYFYARHFKFMVVDSMKTKRGGSEDPGSRGYFYYDETGEFSDSKKRQDGEGATYQDLRSADFAAKTTKMMQSMTGGTDCSDAMSKFSTLDSFDDMSLPEILIWKFCYVAYAVPLGINAAYDENAANGSPTTLPVAPDFKLPEDFFYNPTTFVSTSGDMLGVMKEYLSWKTQYKSIYSDEPQDYVDIRQMPDWFWEYERQIYNDAMSGNVTGKRREYPNGKRSVYTFEPSQSSQPQMYIHSADEIWERLNDGLIFINVPGDDMSVPVINGRYPVYSRNITFEQHLQAKGMWGMTSETLVNSMIIGDKRKLEASALNTFSQFGGAEKKMRESRNLTIDENGNYVDEATNVPLYNPWYGVTNDSNVAAVWRRLLFNMNNKNPSTSSNSKRSDDDAEPGSCGAGGSGGEKENCGTERDTWRALFVSSVDYLSKTFASKPRPDYYEATKRLFESMVTTNDFDSKKERARRNADEATAPSAQRVKRSLIEITTSFPWFKYFFRVVPDTARSIYGRLAGDGEHEKRMFDIHVERRYGRTFDFDSESPVDPAFRRAASSVKDAGVHEAKILTREDLVREYEGRFAKRSIDDDEDYELNGVSPRYESARKKYAHVLGNDTLISHRGKMLTRALESIFRKPLDLPELVNKGAKNFEEKYAKRYLDLYSDTMRVKRTAPTLMKMIRAIDKATGAVVDFMWGEEREHEHGDSGDARTRKRFVKEENEFRRFIYTGDYSGLFKTRYSPPEDESALTKRSHQPPLIPICFSDESERTCSTCKKCVSEECSSCSGCRNCTSFVGGDSVCESCSSCIIGGPNCQGGCQGCDDCANDGGCLNCLIIEEFVSVIYRRWKFCKALDEGDESVIVVPPPNVTLIKVFYRNETNTTYDDVFSKLVFDTIIPLFTPDDVGAMTVFFVEDTNEDPFVDSIGGLAFFRRLVHLPYIRQCNWDIDLQCTFGVGLEQGIIDSFLVTVSLMVFTYLLFPSLAGIISNFILVAGWSVFFVTLAASRAWFYNLYCLATPTSIIYSFLFPMFPILPAFPRCAAEQILALLDKYVKPCYAFLQEHFFIRLTENDGSLDCPVCPAKQALFDCSKFGFTTQATTVGYYLQRYWPAGNAYLNQTCLVKGGCFLNLGGDWGPLKPFFDSTFNVTYFPNGTVTNFTDTLDACGESYFWVPLATLLVFLLILYLFVPFVLEVSAAVLNWIFVLLRYPPFSFLVVWPFRAFVFPEEGNRTSSSIPPRSNDASWDSVRPGRYGGARDPKRSGVEKKKKKKKKEKERPSEKRKGSRVDAPSGIASSLKYAYDVAAGAMRVEEGDDGDDRARREERKAVKIKQL
jgi:hypothetical protein